MSDTSQGPGWWQASDGKWYPPEQAPGAAPQRRLIAVVYQHAVFSTIDKHFVI